MLVEKEFKKLQMVAQYNKKVEPCRYTFNLIFGIVSFVLLIMFLTNMFVAGTLRYNGRQKDPGLIEMVEDLQQSPNWSFLGPILFITMAFYLFYATLIGNIKFGLRFFTIQFYPMIPGETFTNSFIINAIIINIWMHSLIYWIVDLNRQYFRGT